MTLQICWCGMDKKTLQMTMLLDFYGELLTEKQNAYFSQYYNDDLSLSEIAENEGISRQGVRDMIRRAELTLLATEEKIGLLKRYKEQRGIIFEMERDLKELTSLTGGRALKLSQSLIDKLQELILILH